MRLDDPRVSEAHAMVSLRGRQLKLLALRGRIWQRGATVSSLVLEAGATFSLGHGLDFVVQAITLPQSVLGVEGPGLARQALGGVASIYVRPTPQLVPGFAEDADGVLWGEDDLWFFRPTAGEQSAVGPGDTRDINGLTIRFVAIPLGEASESTTLSGTLPLTIVAGYDTVQVHQGEATAFLSGIPARIISELVDYGVAVEWETIAASLWTQGQDRASLRPRFDMALSRLRRKLRDAGIRDDFIVSSGHGHLELVLRERDRIENKQ